MAIYRFGEPSSAGDRIFRLQYHDVYRPGHLPGGDGERLSDDRHHGSANLLFFDFSVRDVRRGKLTVSLFDDGVTSRATDDVWDDFES